MSEVPSPVTAGAIVWYRSPVLISQITSGITMAAALFPKSALVAALGLTDPDKVSALVSQICSAISLLSLLVGTVMRVRSKVQPTTLTAAGAANHPATQAVVQVQADMAKAGIPTAVTLLQSSTEHKQP